MAAKKGPPNAYMGHRADVIIASRPNHVHARKTLSVNLSVFQQKANQKANRFVAALQACLSAGPPQMSSNPILNTVF